MGIINEVLDRFNPHFSPADNMPDCPRCGHGYWTHLAGCDRYDTTESTNRDNMGYLRLHKEWEQCSCPLNREEIIINVKDRGYWNKDNQRAWDYYNGS